MSKIKSLKGMKFGRLTVIANLPIIKNKRTYWLCKCECGNEKFVDAKHLKAGAIRSCGCLRKEYYSRPKCKQSRTRLETVYRKMKSRCNNPHNVKYSIYGGRGIKMCEEWQRNSKAFYQWAMQNGYKDNLTIERIDVNGDYEPNNCKFATYKEQANNTRRNHFVEINGKRKTIAQWAEYYKMSYGQCYYWLVKKK